VSGRFGPGPLVVWWHGYYTSRAEQEATQAALASIPPEAAVAAQNHLIPHLSARREIYEIQKPIRAEYVALHLGQSAWPFDDAYPRRLATELLAGGYGVAVCAGKAVVLKRGSAETACPALTSSPVP
jgi:hypothetical protein